MTLNQSLLLPYGSSPSTEKLELIVFTERVGSRITLNYRLSGALEEVLIPNRTANPERLDSLWEHTCFEAFISWKDKPFYWELNASPSGDWNLYHFSQYRKDQLQERRIHSIDSHRVKSDSKTYEYRVTLDLRAVLPPELHIELEVSMNAVIEKRNSSKSYWAIAHLGKKPDFHLRESFLLSIRSE